MGTTPDIFKSLKKSEMGAAIQATESRLLTSRYEMNAFKCEVKHLTFYIPAERL